MKTLKLRTMTRFYTLLIALALFAVSCKKDKGEEMPAPDLVLYNSASISSTQEVPLNTSSASGTFNVKYDKSINTLTYTINYAGITPTAMHFHKGAIGVSGGVEKEVAGPYSSGMTASVKITDAQELDLLAGLWYLNIHSAALPGGEIRGQVVGENMMVISNVAINGKQEVPYNPSAATGMKGFVTLTAAQETDLFAGLWYLNVHSVLYAGGEIRAQLVK